MKRVFSLLMAVVMVAVLLPLGTVANAAEQEITLSAGDSLADALKNVADGGKIVVDGTVAVTAQPGTHNKKNVTITGGELDFTGLSGNLSLGDHITFENITMTFAADRSPAQAIYANGYTVKIGEGVVMPNAIRIFGGAVNATIASTDLTVLSGYYTEIYGGGNNCNIIGDVNLYVGGDNVNAGIDAFDHGHTHCVYGGGYGSGTIGGTVRTVFTGKAKANYVYGGNFGSNTIAGGVDLTIAGGDVMSVYGGSRGGSLTGNVKLLISGGTMDQVFGGCEGNPMTGDVKLDITRGTITRRVYGGCYNEVDAGFFSNTWKTSHYVTGNIVLTLHSDANITLNNSNDDKAIFAHSRQETLSSTEVTHLVYADSTAQEKNKSKVGAQDTGAKWIMGSTKAADHIHYHTYTASGAVITQNCIDSSCSATATVVVEGTPAYVGAPVKPAKVVYSGDWFGGDLDITYTNNEQPGTGTASITCGDATAAVDFTIITPKLIMNGEGYGCLEDAIAAARKTPGADTITLEQDMEVGTWIVINTDVTITADKAVTITATDDQTGSMFRVIGGGKLTIQGASEDAKITIAAGVNTTNLVVNNGGDIYLTNVKLVGSDNTIHTSNNKVRGIFNDGGIITVKSAEIANMKGDGIYILNDGEVNLEDVTIANTGRYGIKVKGVLNITKGLTIKASGNNAIDIENGGVVNGSVAVNFENNLKDIHVRVGGEANLPYDEA